MVPATITTDIAIKHTAATAHCAGDLDPKR